MILTPLKNELCRRWFLLVGCAVVLSGVSGSAAAQVEAARDLVERAVGEIVAIAESDSSAARKARDLEKVIATYTDISAISRSALGPAARSASSGQLRAYRVAFQGYLARKYSPRFDEFFGGSVTVTDANPWKSNFFQVHAAATLPDQDGINVIFVVSNRGDQLRIFDIVIEGVSILKTEALEIRGLLDRSSGDLDRLTANLQ